MAKAKVILLTGAGASVPLGLYTTSLFLNEFTTRWWPLEADHELVKELRQAVNTQYGDIEDLLALLERQVTAADVLLADPRFVRDVLQNNRQRIGEYIHVATQLRDTIYDKVIEHYSHVDAHRAAALYDPLLGQFLKRFHDIPELGQTLPFFTLNYDVAVESAASMLELQLVDGLEVRPGSVERQWTPDAFTRYEEKPGKLNVVLVKLHGSVRWGYDRSNANSIVELSRGVGRDPGMYRHAVLYPARTPKAIDEEPFRTGFRCFRECLRSARVLVAIGTSFRDPEVNAALRDGMEENPDLHLIVVDPAGDHNKLSGQLKIDTGRLAVLRERFAPPPKPSGQMSQGRSPFMTCLGHLIRTACGVPRSPLPLRFGQTYTCAPGSNGSAPVLEPYVIV